MCEEPQAMDKDEDEDEKATGNMLIVIKFDKQVKFYSISTQSMEPEAYSY